MAGSRTRMYRFAEVHATVSMTPFPAPSEIIFVPTSARRCSKRRCQEFPASSRRWQSLAHFPFSASWGGLSFRLARGRSCFHVTGGEGKRTKGESVSRSLGRFSLIYCAIIGATLARASTSFSGHIETP